MSSCGSATVTEERDRNAGEVLHRDSTAALPNVELRMATRGQFDELRRASESAADGLILTWMIARRRGVAIADADIPVGGG